MPLCSCRRSVGLKADTEQTQSKERERRKNVPDLTASVLERVMPVDLGPAVVVGVDHLVREHLVQLRLRQVVGDVVAHDNLISCVGVLCSTG